MEDFRLILDVTCLLPEKISGIGIYTKNLITALTGQGLDPEYVYKTSRMFKNNDFNKHTGRIAKAFMPPLFSPKQKTIFHGPDFKLLSGSSKYFKVVTIHDLAVFHQGFSSEPFRKSGQQQMLDALNKMKPHRIIVPTEAIKDELSERFPQFQQVTHAIHHGADHLSWATETLLRPPLEKPYFLFVGHFEVRKNVLGIIEAFEKFCEQDPDSQLVLVGKAGFGAEAIYDKIHSSKHKHRIIQPGYISGAELRWYYENALGFVYPSFYEGFGFPIVEAMKLNCPVITSNYGAMKEVSQNEALYVDPKKTEEIAEAMLRLTKQPELRQNLTKKALEKANQMSWEKSAKRLISVYKNL